MEYNITHILRYIIVTLYQEGSKICLSKMQFYKYYCVLKYYIQYNSPTSQSIHSFKFQPNIELDNQVLEMIELVFLTIGKKNKTQCYNNNFIVRHYILLLLSSTFHQINCVSTYIRRIRRFNIFFY